MKYRRMQIKVWAEQSVCVGTEVKTDLHEVYAEDAEGWGFCPKSYMGTDGHHYQAWFVAHKTGKTWTVIDPRTGLPNACGATRDKAVEAFVTNRYERWVVATNDGTMEPYREALELAAYTNAHPIIKRDAGMVAYGVVDVSDADNPETILFDGPVEMRDVRQRLCDMRHPKPDPDPSPVTDPEPVEVVEDVPAEAYADVDAPRKPSKRDRQAEDFRRDYGQLYTFLENSAKRDEHPGDVLLMQHVLTLSGARWTREHPRMYRKLCRWHGDAFTSDRELAALAMWVERSIERESAKTAA